MPIHKIMSTDLHTVGPDEPLPIALMKMKARPCRHLPVVEEGRLVGMLSDRDLKDAWPSRAPLISGHERIQNIGQVKVRSIMTTEVVTIDEEASIAEGATKLLSRNVGALVVVNHYGQLTGIVTVKDMLRELVRLL
ncbi:CBS domain-containing protein [Deinococcus sp. QL22]|uniref:CBS domain-containing protein n=1 Tax=Deinococcus sp. QL22 TaxID=2939437 RepID=UPI002016CC0F|nr:CBS domain-containing protein [Deinococcus sp. QL22]UQN08480.1 CBS domain-containing protein [Deinococcus sp. QL22]